MKSNKPILSRLAVAAAFLVPGVASACSDSADVVKPVNGSECISVGNDNDQVRRLQLSFESLHSLDSKGPASQEESLVVLDMRLNEANAIWSDLSADERSCIGQELVGLMKRSIVANEAIQVGISNDVRETVESLLDPPRRTR